MSKTYTVLLNNDTAIKIKAGKVDYDPEHRQLIFLDPDKGVVAMFQVAQIKGFFLHGNGIEQKYLNRETEKRGL